ncbi:MAG: hypothetical protein IKF14_04635, partial [Atopobiaceae bacterium]|nr:hypothetical protein [Atopobiaceae bacterium]
MSKKRIVSCQQRRRGIVLGYVNIVVKNVVDLLYTPMLLSFVGRGVYGVFQTANSFGFSGAYVRYYMQRRAKGDEAGIRRLNGMYLLLYLGIDAIAITLGL